MATAATGQTPAAGPAGEWPAVTRQRLTRRARDYARGSRAESTWRVYEQRWRRFQDWCAEHDEQSLPADPRAVCRFLVDLAAEWRSATPADPSELIVADHVLIRPGVRPDTVAAYLAAISVAHQNNGGHDTDPATGHDLATNPAAIGTPAGHPMVRRVLAGIRRHPTVTPARRRHALRPAHLETILDTLDPESRLADARDAAILLIGWKAALRTDDLRHLDITDLEITDEGLTVHLRRAKTDQTGVGVAIGITASDPGDPLDATAAWLRWKNRLAAHGLHAGPAWRGIDRYGRRPRATRMTTQALARIITTRATTAGPDGDIGGHSLRRGFATSALAGGATERAVQHHGRWKSPASMAPLHRRSRPLRRHQSHPIPPLTGRRPAMLSLRYTSRPRGQETDRPHHQVGCTRAWRWHATELILKSGKRRDFAHDSRLDIALKVCNGKPLAFDRIDGK